MALAEFKCLPMLIMLWEDQEEDINYINYKSGDKLFRQNIKNAEE